MPRKTSLSLPPDLDGFGDEEVIKGMEKVYGDDVDKISVDDIDPPAQLCCGRDKLLCFSSRLHGSIFVLSIIFMVFYIVTSTCAWIFYVLYTSAKYPYGLVFYLNVSLSVRLVLSIVLLVASLTRRNFWLMIYTGGSIVALSLFCVGVSQPQPLLLLCAPVVIASDFIMFYIIKRFVVENQYFPVILAQKKQRYNTTIRRLLREAKKEDEYQALKEGILKNVQASKESSRQRSVIAYPKTSRPRSFSNPGQNEAKLSIDAILMQTNQRPSKQVLITDPKKPNEWKQSFVKGAGKFWPAPWFKNKMAESGPATMPAFGLEGDHESKRSILRISKDDKNIISEMDKQTDNNKEEKEKKEKSSIIKVDQQKDSNKEEKSSPIQVEPHKESQKDEKPKTSKVEPQKENKDEKIITGKVETQKSSNKDEKPNTSKVETHKDEKPNTSKVETHKENKDAKSIPSKMSARKDNKDEKSIISKGIPHKDDKDAKSIPSKGNPHKDEKEKPPVSIPSKTTSKTNKKSEDI